MTGDHDSGSPVAVLVSSGGVDIAAMTVKLAQSHDRVYPIFVRFGLRWEEAELSGVQAFFGDMAHPRVAPILVLDEPVADLYGPDHWSLSGPVVPRTHSPDDAVAPTGRNLLLVTKAAVWCPTRSVSLLALGSLKGNPFPDSSTSFFNDQGRQCGACNKCSERERAFARAGIADPTDYATRFFLAL